MDLPEPIREQWNLPQHVLDLQQDATEAEINWHIFSVFGYEVAGLEDDWLDRLYRMFHHEAAHSDHGPNRISACKAFARFVDVNGGPKEFGIRPSALLEWPPCDEPFCDVTFD